ncbi:hypothetical protein A9995_00390 [Erythrobacter sp. QSSC1-22B]|uniref:hypothetical protein n=1 Tax=Erythrobacter sp. QSSC1-22B TaxID=1860125 RepID=UPI000805AC51|nr:hypothetical protein [Erythrobacter sp. QSSC1-22B]OBX20230.1 hypothetical protein A9995_00390 [Erythrobacter sp. QSSC1-22B]
MSEFEFLFALYALLLGLSLVSLLGGLGNALERAFAEGARDERSEQFRIGWLSPLMAVFVVLDLMSFWAFAWLVRDLVAVNTPTLLGVVVFASAYYLAARLVFPGDPRRFEDLDVHYFRVHRTILAILVVLVLVQWTYLLSLEQLRSALLEPITIGATVVFVALMIAGIFVRRTGWQIALLSLLIARYLVLYLIA